MYIVLFGNRKWDVRDTAARSAVLPETRYKSDQSIDWFSFDLHRRNSQVANRRRNFSQPFRRSKAPCPGQRCPHPCWTGCSRSKREIHLVTGISYVNRYELVPSLRWAKSSCSDSLASSSATCICGTLRCIKSSRYKIYRSESSKWTVRESRSLLYRIYVDIAWLTFRDEKTIANVCRCQILIGDQLFRQFVLLNLPSLSRLLSRLWLFQSHPLIAAYKHLFLDF